MTISHIVLSSKSMTIVKLPQDIINKIAAGEVVERPASVLKECVENSLDAGASNIRIDLTEGGMKNIQITDNGHGMSVEDAEQATEPHTTSKIQSLEDLFSIQSFGFRGEALASISSVSQFSLTTRREEDSTATIVTMENGNKQITQGGAPVGTTIEVRNLFYNVPARQKYLKSAQTEFKHCITLLTQFALLTHTVNWQVFHNNKPVLTLPATNSWKQRVATLWGPEKGTDLIEMNAGGETLRIQGFLAHPRHASEKRDMQHVFVNNRAVQDFLTLKAVKDGYGSLIPRYTHPSAIVHITVDPKTVDVNVHPRKLEVKFSDTSLIFSNVKKIVSQHLSGFEPVAASSEIPLETFSQPTPIRHQHRYSAPSQQAPKPQPEDVRRAMNLYTLQSPAISSAIQPEDNGQIAEIQLPEGWKVIGQIHSSYLILETTDGMMVMDQHAMSERVNYHQLKQTSDTISSQKCAFPITIDLPPQEYALFEEYQELFTEFGFEIEPFGGTTLAVNALPSVIGDSNAKEAILELFHDLRSEMAGNNSVEEKKDALCKIVACKTAIKFGDFLSTEQQIALICAWIDTPNNQSCIHGRPCTIELSDKEMRKWFKRPSG